jgi:hypothetical protein
VEIGMKGLWLFVVMGLVMGCSGSKVEGQIGAKSSSVAATKHQATARVETAQQALDLVFGQASSRAELEPFPKTVGTKQGVLVPGHRAQGGKDLVGTFETAVAPGDHGSYRVTLTRRWEFADRQFSTTWRFQVQADGTVTELGKTGDNLPEF